MQQQFILLNVIFPQFPFIFFPPSANIFPSTPQKRNLTRRILMQIYSVLSLWTLQVPWRRKFRNFPFFFYEVVLLHFIRWKCMETSYQVNGYNQKNYPISRWISPFLELIFHSFLFPLAGSAKKRDVRTINSSPCDLGPPSKTSTNGALGTPRSSARNITASRKFLYNQ